MRRGCEKVCSISSCLLISSFIIGCCRGEIRRTFRVAEDTPAGALIGYVQPDVREATNRRSDNAVASYLFVYPPKNDAETVFALNERTGEIRTKKQLDYEYKKSYAFLALPTDGSQGVRISIEIQDVNDNAPKFPTDVFNLQISEYAKINSEIPLPSATDADSGQFGVERYDLMTGNVNNAFRLSTRRLNGLLYLDLVVNSELDREFTDNYILLIKASDGGQPPMTAQMTVNVTVLDANDNAPQFDQPLYLAQVQRKAAVGSSVTRVRAVDKDQGINAQVEYRLTLSPGDAQRHFAIDNNGLITVASTLNKASRYELITVARDKGLQPLESTAFVRITVSDDGDINSDNDAGGLKVVYLSDNGSPTISEDAEVGSFVARLSIIDEDKSRDLRRVNVSIAGGDGVFGAQTSRDIIYILLAKSLDRETRNNYTLSLTVVDNDRGDTLRANMQIAVADVNDNAPQFLQPVYEGEINEKATPGSSVLHVTAVDGDDGLNGKVIYSLSPISALYAGWFEIDQETGLITTANDIDCELNSKPEFVVVAKDLGEQPLSATAKVVISIIDVNDNAPVFNNNVYNVSVKEDVEVGTCFLKVSAADSDCGVNAYVRYSIPQETAEKSIFSINENSGSLCLVKALDYETKRGYQFLVSAMDGGGLSSTSLVVISVEDANDNAPVFYPSVYNVSLRRSSLPGVPLTVVSAEDLDGGNYGAITYRIASGDDRRLFRIDSKKGELYINSPLSQGAYRLTVQATDSESLSSHQPAVVNIDVIADDQPSPEFEQTFYRVTVSEDTLPGISVIQVRAKGAGIVTYGIYSGDPQGYFTVDANNGQVLLAKYLDYETQSVVLLNVQASMGRPPAHNHTQIQIVVDDVNDNSPTFEQNYAKIGVPENHDVNRPFFVVKASDRDGGKNGEIRYRLSTNHDGLFLLHVISGELRLTKSLDYEVRRNYTLHIVAQDGGMPPLSANMTLDVEVLDTNDHEPAFVESRLNFVVAENAQPLTRIGQMLATDADAGANGRITYRLTDGDPDGFFGIFGDSGWIYVRKQLDREQTSEFTLQITAKDNGDPVKSARATARVEIGDVNDNAPNCSVAQEFFVEENQLTTTFVGQLIASDSDVGRNGTIAFYIDDLDSSFRINDKGELYVEKPLDRESVYRYDLRITAKDHGQPQLSSVCSVVVHVTDVNDNAPSFVLPRQNRIFYREQQNKGAEVVQVRANDPDRGENGTVKYKLEPSSAVTVELPFSINSETGLITNEKILDYESDPHVYDLNVVAEDNGRPLKRRATRALTVELVDVADGNGRTLSKKNNNSATVNFEVSENSLVGTKLGRVDSSTSPLSTDGDSVGQYLGIMEYTIVAGNSMGAFEIDRSSGVLYLAKKLDYEIQSSHFLTINRLELATTIGRKSSNLECRVVVVDENDNAPQFPEDPVIFSVPENVPANQLAWIYNATDKDTGSFGRIQYRVAEEIPETAVFSVDAVTGELKVVKALDFERCNEYIVVVEATDQAPNVSQRLSTKVTTRVYVTDVNDNRPQFVSLNQAHVFEDEPVGYPVVYLAATDSDWQENGRVTYAIKSGNEKLKFAVNATSGALTLAQRLDREDARLFQLTVVAQDHGNPSLSTVQNLKIHVLDINDNAPRFEQSIYHGNVTENMPIGTTVVQLKAVDTDKGINSELVYILPPGIGDNKFKINEKTGVILTNAQLDREQREQYILTVYVRDSAYPARYDATSVIVNVADVNDNSPVFSNSTCLAISVPENKVYLSLHTLIAKDKDSGANGQIYYSISGGNVDGKFRVNATTGEMSCDPLDRETVSQYNLTVLARDGGSPTFSDTCSFVVHVLDVNDNGPVFDQQHYGDSAVENSPVGKMLLKVRATDADEGANARISYSLINETAAVFDINPETGDLFTIGHLDFETRQSYEFFVEASDQGPSEPRRTVVGVTVTVSDVNDNAPAFLELPFATNVSSDIPAGQRIIKVAAVDADGPGQNSEIYYGFLNATHSDLYGINPTTGVISAKQNLRLQPGSVQYLNIFATDKGVPPRQTVGLVEIVVQGAANGSPGALVKFENTKYEAKIAEHASNGATVGHVRAVGQNAQTLIEYKISGGNEAGIFGIDSKTGNVHVVDGSRLDYDQNVRYQLIIEASVNVVSQQAPTSAFVGMTVEVVDTNDHAPQFLQQRYRTAIWEGKPRGTYVVQVSAVDGDYGENAHITYSIVSGNTDSAFTIENNGVARTNAELDREIVDHYSLTVMASDYGTPPKSGTTVIDVQVIDVNDNSPSFPPARLIKISENTDIGTLLTTITANDVDTYPALTYAFTSDGNPGGYFSLAKFSGRLSLFKPLDYEKQKEFVLEIQVSDELHFVTMKQKIVVLDENDNAPNFVQQFYQVSVPVDTPGGTSIVQVAATDTDSGRNGEVSYSLGAVIPATPGFWIDSTTGAISINNTITDAMEKNPLFQLSVEAKDKGDPPLSTITSVQVQIVSKTSEQQAKFAKNNFNFTIPEDAQVHSVVGKLSVAAEAKHLLFGIKSGDQTRTFNLDSEGNVILMKPLDRETVDLYKLEVTVQTKSNSVANSSCWVTVFVDDINDNTPLFERTDYIVTLLQSAQKGDLVLHLSATDKDFGDNAKLIYEITSGDPFNRFEIESESGSIRLASLLSSVDPRAMRLIVKVSDSGRPPRSSLTSVSVAINDTRDKSLLFPLPLYFGQIAENEPANSFLFVAKAVNRDETLLNVQGVNNMGNYSLLGEDSQYFAVGQSSGEVRSVVSFDYETRAAYTFDVQITDAYGRATKAPARVQIRGVDEYAPEFVQSAYTFRVSYDSPVDREVGSVHASDKDAGIDGVVSYTISDANSYFAIFPNTGTIVVTQSLLSLASPVNNNSNSASKIPNNNEQSKISFTVIAYSGQDHVIGKSNTTSVEIQLGYFSDEDTLSGSAASTTSTAITVSSVVLILIVILLLLLLVKLRCRNDNKPSSVNKVSYPKQHNSLAKSTNGSTGGGIYGNGHANHGSTVFVAKNSVKSGSRNSSVALAATPATDTADRVAVVMPPTNRHRGAAARTQPLNSVSNWSAKSSGRGSAVTVDDEEDEEISRLTSRASNVRSNGPDSGIHLFPEETGSINSELPSTREYLTNLGVSMASSSTHPTKDHDVNKMVAVGKMEALEDYLDAQEDDKTVDGVDVQELIYSKVSEVLADEGDSVGDHRLLPDIRGSHSAKHSTMPEMNDLSIRSVHQNWHAPIVGGRNGAAPTFQPVAVVIAKAAAANKTERVANGNSLQRFGVSQSQQKKIRPSGFQTNLHNRDDSRDSLQAPSPNVWLPQNAGFPVTPEPPQCSSTPTYDVCNNSGGFSNANKASRNLYGPQTSTFVKRKDFDDDELEIKI